MNKFKEFLKVNWLDIIVLFIFTFVAVSEFADDRYDAGTFCFVLIFVAIESILVRIYPQYGKQIVYHSLILQIIAILLAILVNYILNSSINVGITVIGTLWIIMKLYRLVLLSHPED